MRIEVPDHIPAPEDLGRVHFVGIGGAALSGIARIMLARGVAVSGCDNTDSATLGALRAEGAQVVVGHSADHVVDANTLVVSTAMRPDNPDVVAGRRAGTRLLPRSAALASLMHGRRVVSVAGTHGKTTTTSMLAVALRHCGADPTFAVGGDLTQLGTNAAHGSGPLFIAEADESDGAFLIYPSFAAIVTNVDADHLDNWGTVADYEAAFSRFAAGLDPQGFLVACIDDPGAARLAHDVAATGRTVHTIGESAEAELRAVDLRFDGSTSRFAVERAGLRLGEVRLQIPGRHYVLDALCALTAGLSLGFDFEDLAAGLATYAGTRRRMEFKGEVGGIRVYDSYAHHPTEIAGDLQAARSLAGNGRVVVAFQPHMVSRTRIFGTQMGEALGAADEVVLMDIYLAREDPDPEVGSALIAAAVPLPGAQVTLESDFDATAHRLVERAHPGDVILTLGAGTVTKVADQVVALLRSEEGTR